MPNPTTPLYDTTEMVQAQAQPHVIFNEAIRRLEVIAGKVALSFEDTPPGSPEEGDVHVVGTGSGAFDDRDDEIAYFSGGGWLFIEPQENEIWAIDSGWYRFASGWIEITITDV